VGKLERLAKERHARDLELARAPGGHPRGLWFDDAAADHVVQFVEMFCRHSKGEWAGQTIRLEEWQKADVLRPLFGWKRADGLRRYRTGYVELGRKNAKSTIAGAVGLYLLVADKEQGAEVYSSATKRDQARIVWEAAEAMVKQSPELKRFVKLFRNSLVCEQTGSKFMPLSADSNTLDGLNPHGNIVDELHAHTDARVWAVLDTAMGARRQPMTLAVTTAGVYDEESIGWQKHDLAEKILTGVIQDDAFFAFIAAADEDVDPLGPRAWEMGNPNIDVSVKRAYLEGQAEKARQSPSFYNEYLRLHLNRWVQQVTRWLSIEKWKACGGKPQRVGDWSGRECWGGLDLSRKLDLTSLVLVSKSEDGGFDALARFWLPEERVAEEVKKGRTFYADWVRAGWLTVTPGNVVDYAWVRREINELRDEGLSIQDLAYDPYNATQLVSELGEQDGFRMVEFGQGFKSMSEPAKSLEALVEGGNLSHGDHPVLTWCAANVSVKTDSAGNIKPHKDVLSANKVDGIVALIMALGRATASDAAGSSYLETQDMVIM
jgi:phage terminase large subunit-like protein